MNNYDWINWLIGPVCAAIGWIAGWRMRRNDTIKAMQTTIDLLVDKNKDLYDEIMRLRQEKDTLRDEGIKRDNRIAELELEIERLKK